MSNEIMVSVICLAYNHGKYIRNCLEGFVMQKTNFKFEVFVHDDASTDNTADIIREYEAKYPDIIKPIYQTENQYSKGVKFVTKLIYPNIKGKYITWCEGDDFWCDEYKLQKQFDIMESNPQCSICVHNVRVIRENGDLTDHTIPEFHLNTGEIGKSKFAELLFSTYPFHTSSYFAKKKIIEILTELGNTDFNKLIGDQKILRAALLEGNGYYINDIMSCRRYGSVDSWTERRKQWDMAKEMQFYLKTVEGNIWFNEYTEKKYEQYINLKNAYIAIDAIFTEPCHKELYKFKPYFMRCINKTNMAFTLKTVFYIWYFSPRLCRCILKKIKRQNNE